MCVQQLAKIFLIVVNVVFFLLGVILLTLGLISIFREDLLYELANLLTSNLGGVFDELSVITDLNLLGLITTNAIILCVVGAILFLLGFLGMCGACQLNSVCLQIYAIIVLIILLLQVGLGVFAYMHGEEFEAQLQDAMKLAMSTTYEQGYRFDSNGNLDSSTEAAEIGFDLLQIYLGCCGVTNTSDWITEATSWNRTYIGVTNAVIVPPSCCAIVNGTLDSNTDYTYIYASTFDDVNTCITTGSGLTVNSASCYGELKNIIKDNQDIIIAVFVIIIAVEILGIICACYLKSKAEDKK